MAAGILSALDDLPAGARILAQAGTSPLAFAQLARACWDRHLVLVPAGNSQDLTALAGHAQPAAVITDATAGLARYPGQPPSPPGLGLILYTSGSTGHPKGVMLSRDAVAGNAQATAAAHGMTTGTWHATPLPLWHCNALVMSVLGTHLAGAGLAVHPAPFDPAAYLALIAETGATTAAIVPALLPALLTAAPPWPPALRYLITAAAPLTPELAARFAAIYGPRLVQGYGLTETVNFATLMPLLTAAEFSTEYCTQHPPAGTGVAGAQFRCRDGQIELKTPHMLMGYWRASHTGRLTDDGWLRTGDLGHVRGRYLVVTGRADDMINRGGEKLHPAAVEAAWARSGVTAVAAACQGGILGHDIGLWAPGPALPAVTGLLPRPAAATAGGWPATETGKPRRAAMGWLPARATDPAAYAKLLGHAAATAAVITASSHRPPGGRAAYLWDQAAALQIAGAEPGPAAPGPAGQLLDLAGQTWPDGDGPTLMHASPGLWAELMGRWPMNDYAGMAAQWIAHRDWAGARVLEIGAGTGATTRAARPHLAGATYQVSDVSPVLAARAGGTVIDVTRHVPGTWDLIFATNTLHTVPGPAAAIANCAAALAPGGTLLLAEGNGPTTDGCTPWALNLGFGLFPGWWDTGGFRRRRQWLNWAAGAGLTRPGWARLRAGAHDLGGLIWACR